MNFSRWLHQMLALLIAWTILLGVTGLLDEFYGTVSQYLVMVWLCLGIGVMLLKKIDFPVPQADRIDVPGAFRMLWWAAFWPRYLRR
ncbi:hypothetical protein [Noviherbaspirillum pedocola]|uniref:Uncharacterized protein n=1 Tax=Noviherbaspirillum pedocola TaxID=2801341 RepID=A0A934T240_9BURK|nr:hypothetical protein [Noviherbaspirillum pedocola]MBK4737852.1 hypothetical protein [Noviherbaspirillum pedocola]